MKFFKFPITDGSPGKPNGFHYAWIRASAVNRVERGFNSDGVSHLTTIYFTGAGGEQKGFNCCLPVPITPEEVIARISACDGPQDTSSDKMLLDHELGTLVMQSHMVLSDMNAEISKLKAQNIELTIKQSLVPFAQFAPELTTIPPNVLKAQKPKLGLVGRCRQWISNFLFEHSDFAGLCKVWIVIGVYLVFIIIFATIFLPLIVPPSAP